MKKIFTILSICLSMTWSFAWASESGHIPPGPFPQVGMASPMVKSKFFVIEAQVKDRMAQVMLPLDTPNGGIALVLGEPSVKVFNTAHQPLESIAFTDEELKAMSFPAANTRFNLDTLPAGVQMLNIQDIEDSQYVRMVISQPESTLEMLVQVSPLAVRSGEKVTITARFKDEKTPGDTVVKAAVDEKNTLRLNDNGQDGDLIADDGIYSGTFTAPRVTGFQGMNIRFSAEGKRFNDVSFRRDAINTVMITEPRGKILKEKMSVNPNLVIVPIMAAEGNYRVEIIFGFNGTTLAYSRENIAHYGGIGNIELPMPQEALAANQAVVRLLNKDTLGLEEEFEISLTPTLPPPDFDTLSIPPRKSQMPNSKIQAAEKIKN